MMRGFDINQHHIIFLDATWWICDKLNSRLRPETFHCLSVRCLLAQRHYIELVTGLRCGPIPRNCWFACPREHAANLWRLMNSCEKLINSAIIALRSLPRLRNEYHNAALNMINYASFVLALSYMHDILGVWRSCAEFNDQFSWRLKGIDTTRMIEPFLWGLSGIILWSRKFCKMAMYGLDV